MCKDLIVYVKYETLFKLKFDIMHILISLISFFFCYKLPEKRCVVGYILASFSRGSQRAAWYANFA